MQQSSTIGDIAINDITQWLMKKYPASEVTNVELNPSYQNIDVDLIWYHKNNRILIEVKGDKYNSTGNFFFETVSNSSKGTEGCFLYTQADYLFYYFIISRELYIMPIKDVRKWFIANQYRFQSSFPCTHLYNDEKYCSEGKLVPIHIVQREVKYITKIKI
jgi:hypothetical protein